MNRARLLAKWRAVVPGKVANAQAAWERNMSVYRAIESGAKISDIAKHLGLSRSRVWMMSTMAHHHRHKSPVEDYLSETSASDSHAAT